MRIRFLSIGKFKNANLAELLDYYATLCGSFAKMERTSIGLPKGQKEQAAQSKAVGDWLDKNAARAHVTILDEAGKLFSSSALSRQIQKIRDGSHSEWVLVCAGAYGFSEELKSRADLLWSLSPLTMPHELALVVAAEQVFRGLSILANHPYHHE